MSAAATLVDLIEARAAREPDALAVAYHGRHVSLGALNARANAVAHGLRRDHAIGADDRVALVLRRSERFVTYILATLKSGAAYVPISPDDPIDRIAAIVRDAGCRVVLAESPDLDRLSTHLADVETVDPATVTGTHTDPRPSPDPRDLAYILYTSGSTGTPKGVAVEHRAIHNLCDGLTRTLYARGDGRERELLSAPFVFDASIQQTLSCLAYGGVLIVCSEDTRRDPEAFVQYACENDVTLINCVTALLHTLVDLDLVRRLPRGLRHAVTGGERVTPELVDGLLAQADGRPLVLTNMYGPTENCVDSTSFSMPSGYDAQRDGVPIGWPVPGTEAFVLDRNLRALPAGTLGEICVSGRGLARGYAGRPDLTAARFLPHPFRPGERMYRTGDFGRQREDGALLFAGREDEQVKVRGHRVELGEVAARLRSVPDVIEAEVLGARSEMGETMIVGFYRARTPLPVDAVRERLREALPEYMIPARLVPLDRIPRNRNGKADRQALLALSARQTRHGEDEMPRTPTERRIEAIWRTVLGLARVGRHEDFFAIGGHSLRAAQLVCRVRRELAAPFTLERLSAGPSIARMAAAIDAQSSDMAGGAWTDDRIPSAPPRDHYALSHAQRRLWLLHHLDGGEVAYNIPLVFDCEDIDARLLREAFQRLVDRHEILRTALREVDGEPRQFVLPHVSIDVAIRDLRGADDPAAAAAEWASREAAVVFDLARPPLLRAMLLELPGGAQRVLLTIHHVICDGWSLNVLCREIDAIYARLRGGTDAEPRPLTLQYRDYSEWQNTLDVTQDERFWLDALAGVPDRLALPIDVAASTDASGGGFRGRLETLTLSPGRARVIEDAARRRGVTPAILVFTAYFLLLHRLTKAADLCVGMGVAARTRPELEPLIGFFVNVLPIRVQLHEEDEIDEAVDAVRRAVTQALDRQEYPIDRLIQRLNPERAGARQPVFNVMYAYQSFADVELGDAPHAHAGPRVLDLDRLVDEPIDTSKFDLTLYVARVQGDVALRFEYDSSLFRAGTIRRYLSFLDRILQAVCDAAPAASAARGRMTA